MTYSLLKNKRGSAGTWYAFFIGIILFLFLGFILNGLYNAFPYTCKQNFLTNFVIDGPDATLNVPIVGEFHIGINPFKWLGTPMHDWFITQACAFSILPNALLIPIFIILGFGAVIAVIGIVRGM